jgi:hypothetical protein
MAPRIFEDSTATGNNSNSSTTDASPSPTRGDESENMIYTMLQLEDHGNEKSSSTTLPESVPVPPSSSKLVLAPETTIQETTVTNTRPTRTSSMSSSSPISTNTISSTTTTTNTISQPRKSVKFESLHIRTFHRVLGDHPCCSTGLPITFSWNPVHESSVDINDYERERDPRRSRQDMKLDDFTRKEILLSLHDDDDGDDNSNEEDNETSSSEDTNSSSSSSSHEEDENDNCDDHDDVDDLSYTKNQKSRRRRRSNNNSFLTNDEVLSKIDLKRAERRLYRNRQRHRRQKLIAQNFFTIECPIE